MGGDMGLCDTMFLQKPYPPCRETVRECLTSRARYIGAREPVIGSSPRVRPSPGPVLE
jgi:hypothetical protein